MSRKLTKTEQEALELRILKKAEEVMQEKLNDKEFLVSVRDDDWDANTKVKFAKRFLLLGMAKGIDTVNTFLEEIRET